MRTLSKILLLVALLPVLYVASAAVYFPAIVWHRYHAPRSSAMMRIRTTEAAAADIQLELRYRWVPLDSISSHLGRAALAAEDTRFYEHGGFDWEQMREAWEANRRAGRTLRGASTITQQTVKNLYLSPSRNVLRKGREAVLTAWMEAWLPKDRILELYLNVVELGPGIFGAEAASRAYFDRPAARLTREQAALLAATLPAPLTRNPAAPTGALRRRQGMILSRMSRWYEGPSLAAEEATGEVEIEALPAPEVLESTPIDPGVFPDEEAPAAEPAESLPAEPVAEEPAAQEPVAAEPVPTPADTNAP
ncbi:MAG: monofunctional biosynthetic peptidoglycan transglycosylase [Gemmatimonadetes bacterium]|nr:monofunctional biosynthetic peptidoglycan transglycosylase [Gemmatimonadota bacterium]